ncbi:hypothetical protein L7F22_003292 [Adiantum nelumboides]|nr:hypothetical protein [Adiantum nelumboides]
MSLIISIVGTLSLLLFGKIAFNLVQFWIKPYLSSLRKLPGPPAKNWYFGWTTPDVISGLSANISQNHDKYGPTFYGRGVHRVPILYTIDEMAANFVFQNQFSSTNPELFRQIPFLVRAARVFFGSTILGVEEDVHRRQRRAMLPAFTESAVRQASSVMYEVTQDLMNLMRKDLAGKSEYAQVDALNYIRDVSLDIIGRAGFGRDLGALNKKTTKLNEMFLGLVAMITSPSYYALLRFRIPWIRQVGIYFFKEEEKLRGYREGIDAYADDLVKTAEQEARTENAEEDRNVLRLIKRGGTNNGISDEELREGVPILLLAGFETTATTITWAIHAFTRGADGIEKQERLRSELSANEFQGWQSDFTVLNRMPYLDAVCTEVLRLYPALGFINRVCWQDTVIPLSEPITLRDGTTTDKIPIKRGEYVYISTGSLNRNVSIWGENANEFIPERWLRDDHIYFDANFSTNNSSLGGWNHLSTFSQGMRMCLGFRFALAEFKIILAHCIANFDWKQGIDPNTGKPFEIQSRGQSINKAAIKGAEKNQYSLPVLISTL